MNRKNALIEPVAALPHPAEDLSADDDLLSWVLIDQLGALPNTRLGVHPQQVRFVGPSFKTEEVAEIVRNTVIKGDIQGGMLALQEFHLISAHLKSKTTENQRDRFIQHLRRYLYPLTPASRVEIYTTSRYSAVTGHTELAVFATRPLARGIVLTELQGSVVPLPDVWREEMEIGEDFAYRAAEEVEDEEYDSEDSEDDGASTSTSAREKGKGKERDESKRQGARRSDRTKRRDFSIVWSSLKRCFQLFLGPARFLNHDCLPNVELLRQGKYVTFRVLRPLMIGEELTAFYGDNYFGKGNIECLCLTCERNQKGGFTPKEDTPTMSAMSVRSRSRSAAPASLSTRTPGKSALRNALMGDDDDSEMGDLSARRSTPGPSSSRVDNGVVPKTPQKANGTSTPRSDKENNSDSEGSDSEAEISTPRRVRSQRLAAKNVKPWAYLRGPNVIRKAMQRGAPDKVENEEEDEDLPDDFPRCATCAKPLHERVWYANRYFDHCQRCVRHALIFNLPWPAHRIQDVLEFPPSHLIPSGYVPRKISSIPLPTLSKKRREAEPTPPPSPVAMTKEQRVQNAFRKMIEVQEYIVESLRNEAWTAQDGAEQAEIALREAAEAAQRRKEDIKRKRAEEKRKKYENKIRGSGVWSHYEYISEEEMKRRVEAKLAVTSGTRRGGRFRASEDDEEMKALAAKRRAEEWAKKEQKAERDREYRLQHSVRRQTLPAFEGDGNEGRTSTALVSRGHGGRAATVAVTNGFRGNAQAGPSRIRIDDLDAADALLDVTGAVRTSRMRDETPIPVSGRLASPATRQTASATPESVSVSSVPRRRGRPPGTGKHQKQRAKEAMSRQQAENEGREYQPYNFSPTSHTTDVHHDPVPRSANTRFSPRVEITSSGRSRIIPADAEIISFHDSDSASRASSIPAAEPPQTGSGETSSGLLSIDSASDQTREYDETAAMDHSSPGQHLIARMKRLNELSLAEAGGGLSDDESVRSAPTVTTEVSDDEICVVTDRAEQERINKRAWESDRDGWGPDAKRRRSFFPLRPSLQLPIQTNMPRASVVLP